MDGGRLYEVGRSGAARTGETSSERVRRRARSRWLLAVGLGVNAVVWAIAGLALALGGPAWGATFGLLALLTAPLLALPGLDWALAALRSRRRHRRRPEEFGRDTESRGS